jgi:hypothetical protein
MLDPSGKPLLPVKGVRVVENFNDSDPLDPESLAADLKNQLPLPWHPLHPLHPSKPSVLDASPMLLMTDDAGV